MICHIDCSSIRSQKQLHQTFAHFLSFPDWYGQNLDALYDCLTELSTPVHLHLSYWDRSTEWATGFEAVLNDAQENCLDFTVIYK